MSFVWHAFASQWVKLRRPTLLLWTLGSTCFFSALTTIIIFLNSTTAPGMGDRHAIYAGTLEKANGSVYGLTQAATFFGLIAIVTFAFAFASEYNYGTLQNLLVRQPRRLLWLVGSYLALVSLIVVAALLATLIAVLCAYLVAGSQGISTELWTFAQAFRGGWDLALAMIGYGTFGAVLAILLRSPVAAIGVAIGWALAVENLLSAVINNIDRWLPGKLLAAIAQHGTDTISFDHALLVSALYGAAALVIAGLVFRRRDVS